MARKEAVDDHKFFNCLRHLNAPRSILSPGDRHALRRFSTLDSDLSRASIDEELDSGNKTGVVRSEEDHWLC